MGVGVDNIKCIMGYVTCQGYPPDIRPGNNSPPDILPGDLPPEQHLLVVTESGSTYGFQAGGTHPTGMLSCFYVGPSLVCGGWIWMNKAMYACL